MLQSVPHGRPGSFHSCKHRPKCGGVVCGKRLTGRFLAALLGAEKTARGTLRAAYDVQGGWTEDETQGAYVPEAVLDETPRQAGEMRTAHFVVTAADGDTVLYELDTQKYIGG